MLVLNVSQRSDSVVKSLGLITIEAKNDGDSDAFLLKSKTPFSQPQGRLTGNWLSVKDAFGNAVPYRGRSVLEREISLDSFIRLRPGEGISVEVDMPREYAIPSAGSFEVRFSTIVYTSPFETDRDGELLADADGNDTLIESSSVSSTDVQIQLSSNAIQRFQVNERAESEIACTDDQLAQTREALKSAHLKADVRQAILSLQYYRDPVDPKHPEIPPRKHKDFSFPYTYRLGDWDDSAPQDPDPQAPFTDNVRVDDVVSATLKRFIHGVHTMCDRCARYKSSTRAWTDSAGIHLCPANFDDPVERGITTQAGTLVHEVTHQDTFQVPATVDYPEVINRGTAHALDRTQAVNSGANYEYYIMDVPRGF